ncbi:MAG: phosphoribosylanthranilate isomerase [Halioglobus sp.]
MPSTRIKICGITSIDDAHAAVDAGADAIGLVFYPPSSRAVTIEQARDIAAAVPPFVSVVALVVDESAEGVIRILDNVAVDLLQFHGDESPDFCAQFGRPWMKAIRMKEDVDLGLEASRYRGAKALLLDNWRDGVPGGTGEAFDWALAPKDLQSHWVLAGGLNADNVSSAVTALRPSAVDVSGGVERAPGSKDADKIARFIAAVRAADSQA